MTYGKVLIVGLGGVLALVAAVLPFVGLERFAGDVRPVIAAMATAAVGIGCFVSVCRPTVFEPYVKLASLAFFVLMLLGVVGLLSEMDAAAIGLSAGPVWMLGGR